MINSFISIRNKLNLYPTTTIISGTELAAYLVMLVCLAT